MHWSVGVTSAPRRNPTLQACVNALQANNWAPVVYLEPATDTTGIDCALVERAERLGVFHNWRQMCESLVEKDGVSHVLTVQDDAEVVPFARSVLERFSWPSACAFVSLYLPEHVAYTRSRLNPLRRQRGIQHVPQANLHGSVCLAWRVEALRAVLEHPVTRKWPGYEGRNYQHTWMVEDDDICIGWAVNSLKLEMWYAVPGLCQHVSEFVARERDMGIRQSPWVAESEEDIP